MASTDLSPILSSDGLLGCIFLVAIALASLKLLPVHLIPERNDAALGFSAAATAYKSYRKASKSSAHKMRSTFHAGLRKAGNTRRIADEIGYAEKLDKLERAIEVNAVVADGIFRLATTHGGTGLDGSDKDIGRFAGDVCVGVEDHAKVREALKHFVRDWSDAGGRERDQIFELMLDALKRCEEGVSCRRERRVLVPGAGLGRLAWEISQLGFDTTANERSHFMNLAFKFLLSPRTTQEVNQHKFHPYIHWWSHQQSTAATSRQVSFPDVVPRLSSTFHLDGGDFFSASAGWSYIITLFFIDTSLNVIKTTQHIHSLLEPGGIWINLGPLLWTSSGVALELSLDEVLEAIGLVGFELLPVGEGGGRVKMVECEYTSDSEAMMRWLYRAAFWIAKKPAHSN